MTSDVAPLFDAALSLPVALRADLAGKLLESLGDGPPVPDRTPEELQAVINARCEALESGRTQAIDGQIIADKLQAIIDRASIKS